MPYIIKKASIAALIPPFTSGEFWLYTTSCIAIHNLAGVTGCGSAGRSSAICLGKQSDSTESLRPATLKALWLMLRGKNPYLLAYRAGKSGPISPEL